MQKKSKVVLALILGIISISFVSAAYYGGRFSFSDVFDLIEPTSMFLMAMFIITFIILFFALSRFFKDRRTGKPNIAIAAGIALTAATLITYWVNKSNFNLQQIFYNIGYNIGIPREVLYVIIPLIVIAALILLIVKFKAKSLLIIGGLLIVLSFFIYEKTATLIAGIILFIIGIFISLKKKKGYRRGEYDFMPVRLRRSRF